MNAISHIGGIFRFLVSDLNVGKRRNVKTSRKIVWIARRFTALMAPIVVK